MTIEAHQDAVQLEQEEPTEGRVVRMDGGLGRVLRGLLWPFGAVVRLYRGFWWVMGLRRQPDVVEEVSAVVVTPARPCLSGRKRLHRVTRILLVVLPCWVQDALGYPLPCSIGRSLSPEVGISPTKLDGKGSKRKQEEMEDDSEDELPSWVEALSQELQDEDSEVDPNYESSTIETESGEYRSGNGTDTDQDFSEMTVIKDVRTGLAVLEVSGFAV